MAVVLIVSAQDALREMVRQVLAQRGHETIAVGRVAQAERATFTLRFDAAVIASDIGRSQMLGLARFLQGQPGPLPLLYLVGPEERWLPDAVPLRPELDTLLWPPYSASEIGQAMARLLASHLDGDTVLLGAARLHLPSRTLEGPAGSVTLTPTESELLEYLAARQGRVVPVRELLQQIWGFPEGQGPPELVRAHISNLRGKLWQATQGRLTVRTVPRRGYCLQ